MSEVQDLQDKKEVIILDLFLTTQNNSVNEIVSTLLVEHQIEIKKHTVHTVINRYLKNLQRK